MQQQTLHSRSQEWKQSSQSSHEVSIVWKAMSRSGQQGCVSTLEELCLIMSGETAPDSPCHDCDALAALIVTGSVVTDSAGF